LLLNEWYSSSFRGNEVYGEKAVTKTVPYLLVGSVESYSGKSTTILGLIHQLQQKGLNVAYGKPLGTFLRETESGILDEDGEFVAQMLRLSPPQICPMILPLDPFTIQKRLSGVDQTDYTQQLSQYLLQDWGDLVVIEGASNLAEGVLFDLSLLQMANQLDGRILLVCRLPPTLSVAWLVMAQHHLGDRLLGVLINDVPQEQLSDAEQIVRPYLEQIGIPVLGILPRNNLLRSVSVAELVEQLHAQVLCCSERLDLMVESLKIGAMNVNAALKYFRQAQNMAVVTGGDRADIQLAAMETSTQCLILTGQLPLDPQVLSRAQELEVPILSVDLDTLTTVEIVDRTFGQVRLHEPVKVECIQAMMNQRFDCDRLLALLSPSNATGINPIN